LTEDGAYTWRARAVSAGGAGPWSEPSGFRVNTTNSAPRPPLLLAPQNATLVETLTPTLVFSPATDPDGDSLVYDWELSADERFAAALDSGTDVTGTEITLAAPLRENSRVCWRVRADDGQAQSPWVHACFVVSTSDDPPNAPTPGNPSDASVVASLTPVFSWAAAVDPEGAPVFYDVEVKEGDVVVASLTGIGGNAAVASQPLVDGKRYSWRVRATTAWGPASEYSSESGFEVKLPQAAGPTGCGCGLNPGAVWLLGVPLLLRRRRSGVTEMGRRRPW
jgi:hypothetical protein